MSGKNKTAAKAATGKRKIAAVEEVEEEVDENDGEQSGSEDNSSDSNSDEDEDEDDDDDNDDDDEDNENEDEEGSDKESSESGSDKEQEEDDAPKKKGKKAAPAPKKKATKKATKTTKKATKKVEKKAKKQKVSKEDGTSEKKISKAKSLRKSERLEEARKAYKWWEAPKLANGVNWMSMEHAGICFAAPYAPHKIPLVYDGKNVSLTPEQEEIASFFAAIPADGPQLGNPKTKSVFEKNFFEDFREALGAVHEIKKFSLCDFSKIKVYLDNQKNLRKAANDEEKQTRKLEKEQVTLKYGYALIDGRVEKVCCNADATQWVL